MLKFLILLVLLSPGAPTPTTSAFETFVKYKLQDVEISSQISSLKDEIDHLELELDRLQQSLQVTCYDVDGANKNGNFSRFVLENYYSTIEQALLKINGIVAPVLATFDTADKGIAQKIIDLVEKSGPRRCGTVSPQRSLLNIWNKIWTAESMGLHQLYLLVNQMNLGHDVLHTLEMRFLGLFTTYIGYIGTAFKHVPQDFRSCDPDLAISWKRDISFIELERYKQATSFNVSIQIDKNNYEFEELPCEHYIGQGNLTGPDVCQGKISKCRSLHDVTICRNDDEASSRRYQWIKANGVNEFYGNSELQCDEADSQFLIHNPGRTCVCECIEGDYKISLKLTESSIVDGLVVTGIRFARWRKIIFIQIKEGMLGPNGTVGAIPWGQWTPIAPSQDPKDLFALDGENQGVDLDDLHGNPDDVLTGIGFMISDEPQRVRLAIKVTNFVFNTGAMGDRSRLIIGPQQERSREKLDNNNPLNIFLENIPTKSPGAVHDRFITFEQSSLETDAGQTTVPLFDSVPVGEHSPMNGAGIFHKKAQGSPGFLSLRARDIDINLYWRKAVRSFIIDIDCNEIESSVP